MTTDTNPPVLNKKNTLRSTRLNRAGRWFAYGLTGLLVSLALLVALLPVLAKVATVYWLKQQGVEASIENIDIDFNDAVVDVIDAKGKNSQGQEFGIKKFHLDLAWKPLWDKVIAIESIELDGLQLDVVQTAAGLQSVAGLDLSKPTNDRPSDSPESPAGPAWRIQLGNVHLRDINPCYERPDLQQYFCVQLGEFDWLGQLQLDPNKASPQQLNVQGEVQLSNIVLHDKTHDQSSISLGGIQVQKLSMTAQDNITSNDVRIDRFQLFPGKSTTGSQQLAGFGQLELANVAFTGKALTIHQVNLAGINASILRNKNAEWEISQYLQQLQAPRKSTTAAVKTSTEAEAEKPSPLQVKIEAVNFVDSKPIVFVDNSLAKPFRINVTIKDLSVENIDTARPDSQSKIKLHIMTDKYGSIQLAGVAQLMAPARSFDLDGEVKGLDLRPLSAYIQSALDYRIKSGQLNAKIKLLARTGKLDSKLSLGLQQFELKAAEAKGKESVDKDIGLPLGTALNLLRDTDNSIHLDIPITGDVNSPEFDPSDAVHKAVSKAITVAVINYYTPFGLVSAVGGIYNLATALRFEPAVFKPGSVEFVHKTRSQLDRIEQLMQQRPELHLSVCGYFNRDDGKIIFPDLAAAMDQPEFKPAEDVRLKLSALASQRGELVKAYLVKQGIGADRLILCDGEYDATGIAGVDIHI